MSFCICSCVCQVEAHKDGILCRVCDELWRRHLLRGREVKAEHAPDLDRYAVHVLEAVC